MTHHKSAYSCGLEVTTYQQSLCVFGFTQGSPPSKKINNFLKQLPGELLRLAQLKYTVKMLNILMFNMLHIL